MRKASVLKGAGYLTSMLSVMMLAVVSWKAASADRLLSALLIGGVLTSLLGMELRWRSHRLEQREKGHRLHD